MEQKRTVLVVEDEKSIVDILRFNLEMSLWMVADRTYFRSFLSDADMSAVRALPDHIFVFGEYEFFLYVVKKL